MEGSPARERKIMNDYTARSSAIEDREEAIEFYKQRKAQLTEEKDAVENIMTEIIGEYVDTSGMGNESDILAKVCCEYLIKYLASRIKEYEGEILYEQEELKKLIS